MLTWLLRRALWRVSTRLGQGCPIQMCSVRVEACHLAHEAGVWAELKRLGCASCGKLASAQPVENVPPVRVPVLGGTVCHGPCQRVVGYVNHTQV